MNDVLCWLEDLLGTIIGWINRIFNLTIDVPDLGCDEVL